MPVSRYK